MSYYADPLVTLLHGDCIEVMATLPADSVDAVVTDPPYGLEFMGKEWDRFAGEGKAWRRRVKETSDDPHKDWGVFNRTSSRAPHQFVAGHPFQAWCEQWGREALRVTKPGGYLLSFGGTRTHHRLVCALEDAGWIIRDELDWIYASGFPKGKANLKPAHEPIVLARKPGPLRPLAIDECRIGTDERYNPAAANKPGGSSLNMSVTGMPDVDGTTASGRWPSNVLLSDPELFDEPNPYVVGSGATSVGFDGRGPNAVAYKENAEATFNARGGEQGYGDSGGYSRFFIVPKADRAERERGLADSSPQAAGKFNSHVYTGNVGAKQRTPVQARANVHPTVKPIDLMRHLVRLVTPSGGVVLDPFLGSGTTCLAASEEGLRSIGIEREEEYLDIAKGRLMATPMGLGLDAELVGTPVKQSTGKASGYDFDESVNDNPVHVTRNIKSGVHYGDGPRRVKATDPPPEPEPGLWPEEVA